MKEASRKYEQTIVMITHSRGIAQTADRILEVSDGVLTDFGRYDARGYDTREYDIRNLGAGECGGGTGYREIATVAQDTGKGGLSVIDLDAAGREA